MTYPGNMTLMCPAGPQDQPDFDLVWCLFLLAYVLTGVAVGYDTLCLVMSDTIRRHLANNGNIGVPALLWAVIQGWAFLLIIIVIWPLKYIILAYTTYDQVMSGESPGNF